MRLARTDPWGNPCTGERCSASAVETRRRLPLLPCETCHETIALGWSPGCAAAGMADACLRTGRHVWKPVPDHDHQLRRRRSSCWWLDDQWGVQLGHKQQHTCWPRHGRWEKRQAAGGAVVSVLAAGGAFPDPAAGIHLLADLSDGPAAPVQSGHSPSRHGAGWTAELPTPIRSRDHALDRPNTAGTSSPAGQPCASGTHNTPGAAGSNSAADLPDAARTISAPGLSGPTGATCGTDLPDAARTTCAAGLPNAAGNAHALSAAAGIDTIFAPPDAAGIDSGLTFFNAARIRCGIATPYS
jgi:hypothetical protein